MTKLAKLYRISAWTGPTQAVHIAKCLRASGCIDVFPGTEVVYWTFSGDTPDEALQRSRQSILRDNETDFGLFSNPNPAKVIREIS